MTAQAKIREIARNYEFTVEDIEYSRHAGWLVHTDFGAVTFATARDAVRAFAFAADDRSTAEADAFL